MKLSKAEQELAGAAAIAVRRMGVLQYFPTDEIVQRDIMRLLMRMASTPAQLQWLVDTLVDQVGEWKGPVELRGIFCTRFKPKDGIEAESSHHKFSPEANESRMLDAHQAVKHLAAPDAMALVKAKGL